MCSLPVALGGFVEAILMITGQEIRHKFLRSVYWRRTITLVASALQSTRTGLPARLILASLTISGFQQGSASLQSRTGVTSREYVLRNSAFFAASSELPYTPMRRSDASFPSQIGQNELAHYGPPPGSFPRCLASRRQVRLRPMRSEPGFPPTPAGNKADLRTMVQTDTRPRSSGAP